MKQQPNHDWSIDLDALSAEANGLPLDPGLREKVVRSVAERQSDGRGKSGSKRRREAA